MMKMSGRGMNCCVALFLVLTSVSAITKLNSIHDLKKVNFGRSVPEHSLVLLHWFANIVEIDSNNVIRLTFDANRDYGSHRYYNLEGLLDPLPQGYQYYTVGNLNRSVDLPPYVVNHQMEDTGRNRARILIRVREQNTGRQRIDQVYITQHYAISQNRNYDPQQTYRVSPNLLRQIQRFSVETQRDSLSELRDCFGINTDDSDLRDIRNTWGDLAGLGLLLSIVMQGRYSKYKNRLQHSARNPNPDFAIHVPEDILHVDILDTDTSDNCVCVCFTFIIIVIIILVIILILFSHVSR